MDFQRRAAKAAESFSTRRKRRRGDAERFWGTIVLFLGHAASCHPRARLKPHLRKTPHPLPGVRHLAALQGRKHVSHTVRQVYPPCRSAGGPPAPSPFAGFAMVSVLPTSPPVPAPEMLSPALLRTPRRRTVSPPARANAARPFPRARCCPPRTAPRAA